MRAIGIILAFPFRLLGELVRLVRWVLYMLLLLCANRVVMALGGLAIWAFFTAWYPYETPTAIASILVWLTFCWSAPSFARLIVRPGMRMDPLRMPAPPRPPKAARATVSARKTVAPASPLMQPVPSGPVTPKPTRVALLVPPAPPAASPDEASMVARLPPALRELMMQRPSADPPLRPDRATLN